MSYREYHTNVVKLQQNTQSLISTFGQNNNFLIAYSDICLLFIIHEINYYTLYNETNTLRRSSTCCNSLET